MSFPENPRNYKNCSIFGPFFYVDINKSEQHVEEMHSTKRGKVKKGMVTV